MLGLLIAFSLVFTVFLLFLSSFAANVIEYFSSPALIKYFIDVANLNPELTYGEIVAGTLLSYFVATALFVFLLRIAYEISKRSDIYNLEEALKESITYGTMALIGGAILRFMGALQNSNFIVPFLVFISESRRNFKSAIFVTFSIVLLFLLSYFITRHFSLYPNLITALYYFTLVIVPPFITFMAQKLFYME